MVYFRSQSKNCGVPDLRTVKSRKLPRESPGLIHGALAQMVGRGSSTVTLSGNESYQIRGISTDGRTNHPYLRPTGNQFRKPTIETDGKSGRNCYQIRGISTDGRTSLPYCRPRQSLVNQGNPFKMKGNVTRPADVKRGKLPRKTSGNPYGALAQLVARDIRIVEVRGSTPLCSTRNLADQRLQGFFVPIFS